MRNHTFVSLSASRLHRLGIAGLLGLALGLLLSPSPAGEIAGTVTVIKAAQANPNPYQKLYEEMLYPCVRISTASGVGSGVVISYNVTKLQRYNETLKQCNSETYVLTAAHVVGNYSVVTITFYTPLTPLDTCPPYGRRGGELRAAVVMTDTGKDLALLRIETTDNTDFTDKYKARLAPRDYVPYLFTPVWTVGCSLGLDPRPSSGQICAICGSSWEISAPILPGNSGGPVFDAKTHQIIGIAVWARVYNGQLITTMAGIVPISQVYEFLESVESKESNSINSMNSIDSLD